MLETWRWFGPDDHVSVDEMLQSGVQGVVTALHHRAPGQVWTDAEIAARQAQIARRADGSPSGLAWTVVESLPVSEEIKVQGPEMAAHLAAYKDSLRALGRAGVEVVCYNFMPILDWTRTDLARPMLHGGHAMAFDLVDYAVFDIHLLARPGAEAALGEETAQLAQARLAAMDDAARAALVGNVVAGLPGANDRWTLDDVRARLSSYDGIDADRLQRHLVDFLTEVVPVADEAGIRLCAHPDDPPWPLLGLPRILSTTQDYAAMLAAVDHPANGVTLCTGSLGVAEDWDAADAVRRLGPRIHFVHLRNTTRHAPEAGRQVSFYEAAHLEGDTDMVAVLRALLAEEARRRAEGREDAVIPFRPDHGQAILADLDRPSQPGYPLIGRMRGLAELRGVIAGLSG